MEQAVTKTSTTRVASGSYQLVDITTTEPTEILGPANFVIPTVPATAHLVMWRYCHFADTEVAGSTHQFHSCSFKTVRYGGDAVNFHRTDCNTLVLGGETSGTVDVTHCQLGELRWHGGTLNMSHTALQTATMFSMSTALQGTFTFVAFADTVKLDSNVDLTFEHCAITTLEIPATTFGSLTFVGCRPRKIEWGNVLKTDVHVEYLP